MATWLIHLMAAQACETAIAPESVKDYVVGALAPDSGRMLDFKVYEPISGVTHWTADGRKRNSDYDGFYSKMLQSRELQPSDRSFLLGYFVHLATDNLWCKFLMRKYEQQYIKAPEDRRILGEGVKKDFFEYERQKIQSGCCNDYVKLLKGIDSYSNSMLDYLSDELLTDRVTGTTDYFNWLENGCRPYEMQYTSVQEIDETISRIADEIIKYISSKCDA